MCLACLPLRDETREPEPPEILSLHFVIFTSTSSRPGCCVSCTQRVQSSTRTHNTRQTHDSTRALSLSEGREDLSQADRCPGHLPATRLHAIPSKPRRPRALATLATHPLRYKPATAVCALPRATVLRHATVAASTISNTTNKNKNTLRRKYPHPHCHLLSHLHSHPYTTTTTTTTTTSARLPYTMDRLRSGFHHRKARKDSPARPTITTNTDGISSGKTTPEPAAQQLLPLQVPGVPTKKASPFRALRDLSRSHKRARSPATGSETNSPVSARDSPSDRFMNSPHPLSAVAQDTHGSNGGGSSSSSSSTNNGAPSTKQAAAATTPQIPSFLTLSPHEIDVKFQEIVWMERNRMVQSVTNPSSDFRWARVMGDHLRKLDRYMNIQPWQNNRVRLRVPAGKQDYINASPITLTSVAPTAHTRQNGGSGSSEDLAGGGPDRYIAMQGPKHKTTDHVWRMVVEQLNSPGVIVMLTETHEGSMEKCYPYFPRSPDDAPLEVNRKNEFGDGFRASVRCAAIEETEAGDAIELRKLVVRVYKVGTKEAVNGSGDAGEEAHVELRVDDNGDVKMLSPAKADEEDPADENDNDSVNVEVGRPADDQEQPQQASQKDTATTPVEPEYEERIVWHFLYKKWPDFGVPALEDLESFFTLMRLSREKNANPANPRIVHCSAGVGRSGTFIALEHLMREMDAGVLDDWASSAQVRRNGRELHRAEREFNDAASTEGHNGHLQQNQQQQEDDGAASGVDAAAHAAQRMDVEEDPDSRDDDTKEASDSDDLIFHTVNQLREQRRNMVQAEPQFHFIYQVMRKLWEDRYGTNTNNAPGSHYVTPISEHPPRLPTPDGEPAAKRLEFDPFVEE